MSKGEFNSVAQVNRWIENMINWEGKEKDLLALIKYITDEDKLEKVLEKSAGNKNSGCQKWKAINIRVSAGCLESVEIGKVKDKLV